MGLGGSDLRLFTSLKMDGPWAHPRGGQTRFTVGPGWSGRAPLLPSISQQSQQTVERGPSSHESLAGLADY